jgi:hypothetical protein
MELHTCNNNDILRESPPIRLQRIWACASAHPVSFLKAPHHFGTNFFHDPGIFAAEEVAGVAEGPGWEDADELVRVRLTYCFGLDQETILWQSRDLAVFDESCDCVLGLQFYGLHRNFRGGIWTMYCLLFLKPSRRSGMIRLRKRHVVQVELDFDALEMRQAGFEYARTGTASRIL